MNAIDPTDLRKAFGTFLTGVTVVTSLDPDGTPLGFTANSFTSVSLDPPLVLVCLANQSSNYAAFAAAPGFAVNILAETQKDISNTFARPSEDRFAGVNWQPGPHGAPILGGVSAWFDCSMHDRVEAGDHLILIGRVEAYESHAHPGLGYARGAYVTPAAEAEAMRPDRDTLVSVLIEHGGRVLLVDDGHGYVTLPETRVGPQGLTHALNALIARTGANARPGFVYSVYEDDRRKTQHFAFLCPAEDDSAAEGVFTDLGPSTLTDVNDVAMCTLLERYAAESRMGDLGLYLGNEVAGLVRAVSAERS